MDNMIRWLHISDLHLNSKGAATSMLRDEMTCFLREQGLTCDYVFCTGDIRSANEKPNAYTEEMVKFLRNVCDAAGTMTDNMFIVPGNHDIDRDHAKRMEAIRRVKYQPESSGYYDANDGQIQEKDMAAIMKGEADFIKFLKKIYPEDRVKCYGNKKAPHFNVETDDFNILHLDSTIIYAKGQEKSDLIVGSNALLKALETLNPDKPTLLLTHYPFTALAQDEKKILSTMLQKHEVRLWLAGHEHDQVLQKVHYIDSLQAGELRKENQATASFLIGEYNPNTYQCKLFVYAWYSEGWEKYPFVNLDGRRKDIYECELKPLGTDGLSREARAAKEANKEFEYRLPKKVEQGLLPAILDGVTKTSLEELLPDNWHSDTPHVIMLADGGMGKTTMLLLHCKNASIPVLYAPAERLTALGMGLEQFVVNKVYDGDTARFKENLSSKFAQPTLTLFVDGLNEVDANAESGYIRELQRLSMLKGLQILVTSRDDFTRRHSMPEYKSVRLCPLDNNQIKDYFTEQEWTQIQESNALCRLLQNPMLVTVYKEICSVIDEYRDVEFLDWILPVRHALDLFHDYYVAQLALMMKRTDIGGQRMLMAFSCIRGLLPAIAYAFESAHSLNKENAEFRDLLQKVLVEYELDAKALASVQEFYRERTMPNTDALSVTDLLINELRLLYRDSQVTSFPHQMFRDYLSAHWIIRQSQIPKHIGQIWNGRAIPLPVMNYIRQSSGAYWNDGIANAVKNEGEKLKDKAGLLIDNLLQCFPNTKESGVPDYSGLCLEGHLLPLHQVQKGDQISLKGATIDRYTLGLTSGDVERYFQLCLSEDYAFLAAYEDKSYSVVVFSLFDDFPPFLHKLGKRIAKMEFHGNRLYVLAGSLYIYTLLDNGWSFTGEIKAKDGSLTRQLKGMVESGGILYLYYHSRLETYDLADGLRKEIINGKLWENPVKGEDLSSLRQNTYPILKSTRKQTEVISETGDETYKAVSYGDGRLVIMSGTELVTVLKKGKTMLMDAAISGDGHWAATLSFKVYDQQRKIQLWSLDKEMRVEDFCCPQEVERIYLSETGLWLLGESNTRTWTFDWRTGQEMWYAEHFVPNHAGRLVTYGNQVVRKKDNALSLYDLGTRQEQKLSGLYPNPKLVCFLPDGTLAAVDESGKHFRFNSTSGLGILTVTPEEQNIVSIQALKGQPYIIVFTEDQRIRIYHTGNKQCLRNEAGQSKARILVSHPEKTLIADSDGLRFLETHNYYQIQKKNKPIGWWYANPYRREDPAIDGDILDIAFNAKNKQLVAILANGRIVFCNETYCRYQGSFHIITAFDVSVYDFKGCQCPSELKEQLRHNGAEV